MSKIATILGGAAILATVGLAGQANATGVSYSDSWQGASNTSSTITYTGADLSVATGVDGTAAIFTINSTVGTNNQFFGATPNITFNPLKLTQNSSVVTTSPLTASWYVYNGFAGQTIGAGGDLVTFTFSTTPFTSGSFTLTGQSSVNQYCSLGSCNDTLSFIGYVTDSLNLLAPQEALLNIQIGQSGGSPVSGALTFTTPYAVPEPVSIAVLGMGLLGLAAVRRRA
jgi:hypothetical protein